MGRDGERLSLDDAEEIISLDLGLKNEFTSVLANGDGGLREKSSDIVQIFLMQFGRNVGPGFVENRGYVRFRLAEQ